MLRGIGVQDAFDHLCAERKGHLLGEGGEAHQGNPQEPLTTVS